MFVYYFVDPDIGVKYFLKKEGHRMTSFDFEIAD